MGTVYIDGEKVEFEGGAPGSCSEACSLVEDFLAGQGLALGSVMLEGEELTLEEASSREGYELLEFRSASAQAQLLAMCRSWRDEIASLSIQIRELSAFVLRNGWGESQDAVVALTEKLRPVIEGVGVLQQFGTDSEAVWRNSVSSGFQKGLVAVDQVVNAVESRDCARLSDRLAGDLATSWEAVSGCLESEVIPILEEEVAT
ncbi:hypothetical protein [Pelagicoccus sp. SDUM812002]|uniref:hypothetical protein n=1 Tax=Pelagicoccus sp. SDUM812002 TaxID=3041266 RepID=UPI00280E2950|nr:hypothetical protein [Pelagicoccus sp. SDUM812002]MDQ8186180.1 hypothetical protein [Pelagicoccus sp. SDUM812002]